MSKKTKNVLLAMLVPAIGCTVAQFGGPLSLRLSLFRPLRSVKDAHSLVQLLPHTPPLGALGKCYWP